MSQGIHLSPLGLSLYFSLYQGLCGIFFLFHSISRGLSLHLIFHNEYNPWLNLWRALLWRCKGVFRIEKITFFLHRSCFKLYSFYEWGWNFFITWILDFWFKLTVHNIYLFFLLDLCRDMMHCLGPPSLPPQLLKVLPADDLLLPAFWNCFSWREFLAHLRSLLRLGHTQSQALLSQSKNSLKGLSRFRALYPVSLFYKRRSIKGIIKHFKKEVEYYHGGILGPSASQGLKCTYKGGKKKKPNL